MTDTTAVLHHIAELYAKPRKDQSFDDAVLEYEEKLQHRFEDYDKAFAEELTSNIVKAVDDFWRYKSDKTRPTIAQIMAMVNSDGNKAGDEDPKSQKSMKARILKCAVDIEEKFGVAARNRYIRGLIDPCGVELKPESNEAPKTVISDPAVAFMQRDIRLGRCRHLLPVYQAAVRYIAEDILAQEIPVSEWRRMTFAERCAAAMKRGLFNSFDEAMVLICRRNQGKDFQFESGGQIVRRYDARTAVDRGIERVAAHFRTDEAEMAKAAGF